VRLARKAAPPRCCCVERSCDGKSARACFFSLYNSVSVFARACERERTKRSRVRAGSARGCESSWGVRPRPEWARVALGGKRIEDASNIVFSNGLQDPWHGGGVLRNLSSSLLAVIIPNGAHHIDLMFSDDADALYPDVLWARRFERAQIRKWVNEHARQREGELAALLAPRSQIDAA